MVKKSSNENIHLDGKSKVCRRRISKSRRRTTPVQKRSSKRICKSRRRTTPAQKRSSKRICKSRRRSTPAQKRSLQIKRNATAFATCRDKGMESKDCEKKLIQISRTAKENIESLVNKLTSAKIDNSEFLIQQQNQMRQQEKYALLENELAATKLANQQQNQMRQQEKYALLVNELAATKLANSKLLVTQQIQMRQQEAVDRFRLIQNKQLLSKQVQNVTTPIADSNKVVQLDKLWAANNSPMTIPIAKETVHSIPFPTAPSKQVQNVTTPIPDSNKVDKSRVTPMTIPIAKETVHSSPFTIPFATAPSLPLQMAPQNILTDYVKKFVDILAKSSLLQGIIIDTIFTDEGERVNATKLIGLESVREKIADILDHETVRYIINEPNETTQVNILLNSLSRRNKTTDTVKAILKECPDVCSLSDKYDCSSSSLAVGGCKPNPKSEVPNNEKPQVQYYYTDWDNKLAEEYFTTHEEDKKKAITYMLADNAFFPQELESPTDKKTYLWKEKVAIDAIEEALTYIKAYELNLDILKNDYTNDAYYNKQLLSDKQKTVFIYGECVKAQLEDITDAEKYFALNKDNYTKVSNEFINTGSKLFSYFTKMKASSNLSLSEKQTLEKIILHKFVLEKIHENQEKYKKAAVFFKAEIDRKKYKKAADFFKLLKEKLPNKGIYNDQMLLILKSMYIADLKKLSDEPGVNVVWKKMYSADLETLPDDEKGIVIFLYDKIHDFVKVEAISKLINNPNLEVKLVTYFNTHPLGEGWVYRDTDDVVYNKLLNEYKNSPFMLALEENIELTTAEKKKYERYIVYKLDKLDRKDKLQA